jgi:hypothetical protein
MKHLTEEELTEHYYSKGEGKAQVAQHLEACGDCAFSYTGLQYDLDELKAMEPPARDESYGERVWAAIAPSLAVYQVEKRRWLNVGLWKALSFATACALLLGGGFYAGRIWEQKQRPPVTASKIPPPEVKQHVVVVVLSDHLDRSERLLVELKHADASSAEMVSPMRDEARSLLAANRICRQNAAQSNDPALQTALDHLDGLLAELANQPGGLNTATIARLQDQMNANGLLFEVRVLRSRIPDQAAAARSRSDKGAI